MERILIKNYNIHFEVERMFWHDDYFLKSL